MGLLDDITRRIVVCTDCALYREATRAVPGEGSETAEIMFIGEGPGLHEDRQGRPFVGPAGQLLNDLLASIGLRREDVYITNMVKHRPPQNRDPAPDELEACRKYMDEQIIRIKPKIIIPLGRHALGKWFPNESISRVRAKARRIGDLTLFPLYHPAAALHNAGLRPTLEKDFQELGRLLKQLQQTPAAIGAVTTEQPQIEQKRQPDPVRQIKLL